MMNEVDRMKEEDYSRDWVMHTSTGMLRDKNVIKQLYIKNKIHNRK